MNLELAQQAPKEVTGNYDLVNTNQPSDPAQGANRKNKIDPFSLPSNEPSKKERSPIFIQDDGPQRQENVETEKSVIE